MTKASVFVGGLPWAWTQEDLLKEFEEFQPQAAKVIMDRDTGNSRGFGFVDFSTPEMAQKAIDQVNGRTVGRMTLTVRLAEDRRGGPTPRGAGGPSGPRPSTPRPGQETRNFSAPKPFKGNNRGDRQEYPPVEKKRSGGGKRRPQREDDFYD